MTWSISSAQAIDGSIRSARVVADCSFNSLQTAVLQELQEALEVNPNLLKKEKFSELERAYSDRTEVTISPTFPSIGIANRPPSKQCADIHSGLQAWVERTDSALDYTAYIEGERSPEASKQHRYSCGPLVRFKRRTGSPAEPSFLFTTPAIPEEPAESLKMLWP